MALCDRGQRRKRIFLIVLDSSGIGETEDTESCGDKGTSALQSVSVSPEHVGASIL